MPDAPPIRAVIGLSPDDTVRAFEARDALRATVRWSEMWHEDHARAFTVAKVANLDLLATIRASLDRVLRDGGTFEQWQAGLVPELQRAGWWGLVDDAALTGADHPVFVSGRRLRTIYDTNLRVSRAAGRWARIQELKGARPFLRYTAVMDARTRPEHRRWHGTILPVDHEWWDTHFPPCGWFCRCTVRQLSQRELDAKGWTVSAPPVEGPPRLFYPAGRAEPVAVPAGIAPGFAYNPGKASMAAIADRARRSLEVAAATDRPAALAALDDLVASDAFLETLAEPGAAFPVMVLDDASRAAIGADPRVVVLSSDTYAKQRRQHPELAVADYRKLPLVGADPDVVAVEGDQVLKLLRQDDGSWLVAIVKRTAARDELYLTSFRLQNAAGLARLLKKTTIIVDRRK